MMDHNVFERGLAGEPALRTDLSKLEQKGSVLVRRRRNLAVSTVAVAAVLIVLGAALIPRVSGSGDAASPAQIPGCAVVLGPTDSKSPSTSSSAAPNAGNTSALLGTTLEPSRAEARTVAAAPTMAPSSASITGALADLSQPPDSLTAVLWKYLQAWGVSAHATSQLGNLTFNASGPSDVAVADSSMSLNGWASSTLGEGEIFVQVARNEQGGPPDCHVGELDRRITYPDGTVVDLNSGTNLAFSNVDAVGVPVTQFHAVAYKPDGSMVIAYATNAVQLGDENPESAGVRPTTAPPLTLEQVQELAVDPAFSTGSAAYAEALARARTLVPDVVGLSLSDATEVLRQAGFTSRPKAETPSTVSSPDLTTVQAQSPAAGAPMIGSTPVVLTVGGAADESVEPDVPSAVSTE